jgi:hypothetical protein
VEKRTSKKPKRHVGKSLGIGMTEGVVAYWGWLDWAGISGGSLVNACAVGAFVTIVLLAMISSITPMQTTRRR